MSASKDSGNTLPSTSLVKYLQIQPNEPIFAPSSVPAIPIENLVIHRLSTVSVPYYRTLYNGVGAMVRQSTLLHTNKLEIGLDMLTDLCHSGFG
jgi:hypothetical protein